MNDEKMVLTEKNNGFITITMNRAAALNSLHPTLIDQLVDALLAADKDPEVKAIILTGAGKAFCAGGDLAHLDSLTDPVSAYGYIEHAGSIVKTIANLNKPVIAMVNGVAAGAGFNLVLACDIVICAKSARFAQSFSKIGLIPDCGGTYLLPRAVGLHKAKELMFTADLISSADALQYGFVNQLVEDCDLKEKTNKFAERLVASAPVAITFIKKALNQSHELSLVEALGVEATLQGLCLQTQDNKEGIQAFKEKRVANFIGK